MGLRTVAKDDFTKKIESGELSGTEAKQFTHEFRHMITVKKRLASDARGNRDAVQFAEAAIDRNIIRRRKAAGLSQKQLAARAGIRVEILNRIERRVVVPSVRTLTKIELALSKG